MNGSTGYNSLESDDEDEGNIYYQQMEPILTILWRGGIRDLPPGDRFNRYLFKLGELFLLQYYWDRSDVLTNLADSMGGQHTIESNTTGENIIDFYNAAKTQLRPYLQEFLNHHL